MLASLPPLSSLAGSSRVSLSLLIGDRVDQSIIEPNKNWNKHPHQTEEDDQEILSILEVFQVHFLLVLSYLLSLLLFRIVLHLLFLQLLPNLFICSVFCIPLILCCLCSSSVSALNFHHGIKMLPLLSQLCLDLFFLMDMGITCDWHCDLGVHFQAHF